MINHVSFDVWGTLVTANAEFAKARAQMISDHFEGRAGDAAAVKKAYTETKRFVDNAAIETGAGYTTDSCYAALLLNLGFDAQASDLRPLIRALRRKTETLFAQHPPIIADETKHMINFLREKDITMSISSNSNFISGLVMMPFLQSQFAQAFSYGVFSDLVEVAKPNERFFEEVVYRLNDLYDPEDRTYRASNILHVGDHHVCDGVGAAECGMPYVILNDVADIQPAFRHLAFLFRKDN